MKLTKEQFIKRVEEITGFEYESKWCSHFYFRRSEYDGRTHLEIYDNAIKAWYTQKLQGLDIKCPMIIDNEWITPLGEVIKEYYGEEDERC